MHMSDHTYMHIRIYVTAAFWYVFWDDFWSENKEMSVLEDLEEYFNPSKAKALCYYIMERPSLEKILSEKGLLGGCIKELFSAVMLDALYKKVDELRPYASNLVSNTVNEKVGWTCSCRNLLLLLSCGS